MNGKRIAVGGASDLIGSKLVLDLEVVAESPHLTSAENVQPAPATRRRLLLACGVLSSLVYAGMDVIGGAQWQSYSWISQEFSRLSAVGTPSRSIHLVLSPIYTLLVAAFGLGVWWSAGRKRPLRVVGGALVAYALVSVVRPQFFPENLASPVSAFTNVMHIGLTIVTLITWLFILGFGATAFGKQFRRYSIGTLLTVIVFGALTGPQGAALAAGEPTPWLGLTERINIYSFMLWLIVLAIGLLRANQVRDRLAACNAEGEI